MQPLSAALRSAEFVVAVISPRSCLHYVHDAAVDAAVPSVAFVVVASAAASAYVLRGASGGD